MKEFLKKLWSKLKYILVGAITALAAFFAIKQRNKKDPSKQVLSNNSTIQDLNNQTTSLKVQEGQINQTLKENTSNQQEIDSLLSRADSLNKQSISQAELNKQLLK